ncbi:hypothetical protein ERJ75_000905800 [Trypanosoma vivax]|nr:hypothetical protein ERJ75_000905800 [Trypanosoma vivax]
MRRDARPWQPARARPVAAERFFGGPPAETGACGAARRKERADEQTQSQRQVAAAIRATRQGDRDSPVSSGNRSARTSGVGRAPERTRYGTRRRAQARRDSHRVGERRLERSAAASGDRDERRRAGPWADARAGRWATDPLSTPPRGAGRDAASAVRKRRPVATFPPPAGRAVPGGPGRWSVGCRRRMRCRAAVDALTATSVRQPGFASQPRGRRQGARCAHARSKARRCGRGRQVSAFFACERKRAKQPPQPTESCGTKQGSTRRRQRRRELTAKTQRRRKK